MTRLIILLIVCFGGNLAFAQFVGSPVYEPFSDSTASGGTAYASGDFLAGQSPLLPPGFQSDAGGHDGVQSWWEYGTSIYTNGVVATQQPVIADSDLTYPGLATARGGRSARFGGNGDHALMNLPVGSGGFVLGNAVYFSFAVKITDLSALDTNGTFFAGFTQLQSYDHPYGTPMAIGARVWVKSNGAGGFNLGMQKGGKGPTYGPVVWDPSSHQVSETLFLVGRYGLIGVAGNSGGIDDEADLWINPGFSKFGDVSAPMPNIIATETAGDVNDLDLQRIASFILLDNADNEPVGQIDDLRIGLQWADVTPADSATAVELQSATSVSGPFAPADGQLVDAASKTIILPLSGDTQFYSVLAATPVTITGIHVSGDRVILTYN